MEDPRQPLGPNELVIPNGPQEIEIAYILQNSQSGDHNLVDILVDSYAEEVHRLIQAVLFRSQGRDPLTSEVYPLVVQTFVDAVNHCDQFWGEASVRKWLYTLAKKVCVADKRTIKIRINSGRDKDGGSNLDSNTEKFPSGLDDLSERQYLAIVLHVLFGLTTEEVADVVGEKSRRIHEWSTNIRHKLISKDPDQVKWTGEKYHKGGEHKINRSRVQRRIDGMIEQNSEEAILLREHLSFCYACKAYAGVTERSWDRLKSDLSSWLPHKTISEEQFGQLKHSIRERLTESTQVNRVTGLLKKAAWITFLFIVFAYGTWALIRVTPEIGEFPPTTTPTSRFMPTPIFPREFSAANYPPADETFLAAYALGPEISEDGRWIAFTSNVDPAEGGDLTNWLSVLLYDAHSGTLESIRSQVMPIEQGFFSSPDISGDGRWIVFGGMVESMDAADEACRSQVLDPCMDIFLYDRIDQHLSRLTHGYDGGFANGPSMAPSISSNGRWIVFWSAASNLVEDGEVMCEVDGQNNDCADLYIFDRIDGDIKQVAIGRSINSEQGDLSNIPAVGISDDGRWLLLTIQKTDRIANKAGLQDEFDVFLYNQEGKVFTLLDVAPDGTDGNGLSANGQMTPDGRYIIFYSSSDNLVAGDENAYSDVFLLDRNDREIELISKASDSTQANGESGMGMGIGSGISITDDGRYVVFTSAATSLDPRSPGICQQDHDLCIFIYMHDLTTGDTKRLDVQEKDHFAMMADISGDGGSISYIDVNFACAFENGICIDLKLYDQERAWTSEITRSLFPRDEAVWVLDTVLETASENIFDIEFSPDGKSIALVEVGPLIEIKSIPDGRLLHTLRGKSSSSLLDAAFSPDGEYIAGGASDGAVSIWRTSDGSLAYVLDNHPGRINDLQFSDDGEFLFVATPKAVWGWKIEDGKFTRLYALDYADQTIKDIDLTSSNRLIAITPASEPFVWIQRVSGGDVIHRLAGYGRNLSSVAFSPDDNYLVSQFQDGLTQIWRMSVDELGSITPELIEEFMLPGPLGKVVISSDSRYAAVGSSYGGVYVWEIPGGRRQLVPNSQRTIYIDDVDISPSGSVLAASSRDGIYLWHNKYAAEEMEFFRQISTDEFIQIPNRRRPLQDALTSLQLGRIEADGLTLYQADEQTNLDVHAPFKLPSNVSFVTSSILDDSSVLSHYRVYDPFTGLEAASLYFLQQPLTESFRPFWVGASGVIEQVEFNGRPAEFVKGDWVSLTTLGSDSASGQDSQDLYWAWDNSDVQQLRWRHLNQLFSLIFIPRQDSDQAEGSISSGMDDGKLTRQVITKYDLIEIASGISELRDTFNSEQILIDYTVMPGDTCTSIADRYGATVEQLIQINDLAENCDVIIIGQKLQVPLPHERLPLTEADLDCDGRNERLLFIPVPGYPDSSISYGFVLDTLTDIGLFETVWKYTIADEGITFMIRPELFNIDGCKQLFAVNLMPLDPGYYLDNEPGLRVFSWNGEFMKSVFTADGWLQSVDGSENGEVTLTTLYLEYLPNSYTCNRINVLYTWDGTGFNETARYTEENGSCEK